MSIRNLLLVKCYRLLLNASFLIAITLLSTKAHSQPRPNDGCPADYWKGNTEMWDQALDPLPQNVEMAMQFFNIPNTWDAVTTELYSTVFNLSPAQMSAAGLKNSLTLFQAIRTGGKGFSRLARQSVAALLNAGAGYFPYSVNRVITLTHDAFLNNEPDSPASLFEIANDGNCIPWPEVSQPTEIHGPTIVCSQLHPLTYTAIFDASYGAKNYKWSLKNNTAGAILSGSKAGLTTDNSLSINVAPSNDFIPGGQFDLQLTLSNGGITEVSTRHVQIIPANNSSVYIIAEQSIISNTHVFQLSAVANCESAYSYQWSVSSPRGGNPSELVTFANSTSATTTAAVNLPGLLAGTLVFTVQITDLNGLVTTASITVMVEEGGGRPINTDKSVNPVSQNSQLPRPPGNGFINTPIINDMLVVNKMPVNLDTDIFIYPNPNKGLFKIYNKKGIVDISLINMLGVTVEKQYKVQMQTIQLKAHKPGMYTVLIYDHSTGKQVSKKVMILE